MNQYNKDKTGQTRLSYWMTWLMCVLCALVLWVYVMNEQNPITTKIFRVPLKAENLAEDMVVKDMPETVNVKISGTRSQIAALREGDIQAYVDFPMRRRGKMATTSRPGPEWGKWRKSLPACSNWKPMP